MFIPIWIIVLVVLLCIPVETVLLISLGLIGLAILLIGLAILVMICISYPIVIIIGLIFLVVFCVVAEWLREPRRLLGDALYWVAGVLAFFAGVAGAVGIGFFICGIYLLNLWLIADGLSGCLCCAGMGFLSWLTGKCAIALLHEHVSDLQKN
jgi:hypothetical protein